MSTYYGGCYTDVVNHDKLYPSQATFITSAEQSADRVNHLDETCGRCMKSIALGVICQRSERLCVRYNDQRSPGSEFVNGVVGVVNHDGATSARTDIATVGETLVRGILGDEGVLGPARLRNTLVDGETKARIQRLAVRPRGGAGIEPTLSSAVPLRRRSSRRASAA
jgi:hypothetical protein